METSKPNILVVDDQEKNLFAMQQLLKQLDCKVYTAISGEEGLSLILRHEFALILLDVQMPEMDGFEMASIMRSDDSTSYIPIIFVTAISKEEKYVFQGYEAGAVDYIFKPFDPQILISKVKVFIELDRKNKALAYTMERYNRLSHQRELLLNCAAEGILGLNADGNITFANPKAVDMLGQEESAVIGHNVLEIMSPPNPEIEPRWSDCPIFFAWLDNHTYHEPDGQFWRADGRPFPVEFSSAVIKEDDEFAGGVVIFQDITAKKDAKEQLMQLAQYDQLTGLANRILFRDFMVGSMARSNRRQKSVGLLFLDLDKFKDINDNLGHDHGDELLKQVGERLKICTRASDLVARLGGDEFAIVLDELAQPDDAANVAEKVLESIHTPFIIKGQEINISTSIGIATYPDDDSGRTPDEVIKAADTAMYHAKEQGRNNYQFFAVEMADRARKRLHLESELRRAAENKDFLIAYQPQVSVKTGKIVGMEALLRWRHSDLGMISPAEFIPAAENIGLISVIGEWVLHEACKQQAIWQEAHLPVYDVSVAINVSPRQLRDGTFCDMVKHVLTSTDLDPRHIEIELTESTIMENPEMAIPMLKSISDMGVKISVDDFGTGYSSLSYLKLLPIDALKIDQSFVRDIGKDTNDESIVRAIIALAHSLGLTVVAEGVESEYQAEFLRNEKCDLMQGYYFSKPVATDVATQLIKNGLNIT